MSFKTEKDNGTGIITNCIEHFEQMVSIEYLPDLSYENNELVYVRFEICVEGEDCDSEIYDGGIGFLHKELFENNFNELEHQYEFKIDKAVSCVKAQVTDIFGNKSKKVKICKEDNSEIPGCSCSLLNWFTTFFQNSLFVNDYYLTKIPTFQFNSSLSIKCKILILILLNFKVIFGIGATLWLYERVSK